MKVRVIKSWCTSPVTIGKIYEFPRFTFDNGDTVSLNSSFNEVWTEWLEKVTDKELNQIKFNYLIL